MRASILISLTNENRLLTTMFATTCSFCQHENRPGARFCAECGSPLHLKVCQECGKVSDVTSLKCESCGVIFPEIDMVSPSPSASPAIPATTAPPPQSAAPKNNLWPLIAVAAVAGGLPFLWIYRNDLPMPKTWQSRAETSAIANVPSSTSTKPPAQPVPIASDPQETSGGPPVATVAGTEPDPAGRSKRRISNRTPASTKRVTPVEPSRPCTEAVAALGLCDPAQGKK